MSNKTMTLQQCRIAVTVCLAVMFAALWNLVYEWTKLNIGVTSEVLPAPYAILSLIFTLVGILCVVAAIVVPYALACLLLPTPKDKTGFKEDKQ